MIVNLIVAPIDGMSSCNPIWMVVLALLILALALVAPIVIIASTYLSRVKGEFYPETDDAALKRLK